MLAISGTNPLGLYASHSADETSGSLRQYSLAPVSSKNALADGSTMFSSRTVHWLSTDAALHVAWASAYVTCPVHTDVVHGKRGCGGGTGGGGDGGGGGVGGQVPLHTWRHAGFI